MALKPATLQTLEFEAPGGLKVVLREQTGQMEVAVAEIAGLNQARKIQETILRSLVAVGGRKFDASEHTAETCRALFNSKQWIAVTTAYGMLNSVDEEEADQILESFRFGNESDYDNDQEKPPPE